MSIDLSNENVNTWTLLTKRYTLNSITLISISVLFMIIFDNHAFWSSLIAVIDLSDPGMYLFLFACFSFIFAVCFTFFSLFGIAGALKPLIAVVLILAAMTSYYMDAYGTVFDDMMVMNILQTNLHETLDLIEPGIFIHLLLFGLLPVLLLYRFRVKSQPYIKALSTRLISVTCVISIATLSIYASYKDFSFVFRENREISFFVNPVYPVRAMYRYTEKKIRSSGQRFVLALKDAHKIEPMAQTDADRKKTVFIMVVGETARAQNFHIDGYERGTTPELEKQQVISFKNVKSCGTATAISLPCMFSDIKHANFDDDQARNRQNLLDALNTAGLQVLWRENNPDCKGICDRIETQQVFNLHIDELCKDGQCYDEALMQGLDNYLSGIKDDAVIVLHTQGSHGPAYYKRFPDRFKKFMPECRSSEVQDCTDEELVNAYDNTILYTDHFLSKIIQYLKQTPEKFNTAMMYVSDHGESLGEKGVYLHGLPYFMAPEYQTHIPMIMWLSQGFVSSKQLDLRCLKAKANDSLSHDNIFHSVLGIMDVSAGLYDRNLDVFASCRSNVT